MKRGKIEDFVLRFQSAIILWRKLFTREMEIAKELVLTLKQNNTSHVGYGLQKECEALVGHILQNMIRSQMPSLHAAMKNEKDSIRYREEGMYLFLENLIYRYLHINHIYFKHLIHDIILL